MPLEVEVIRDGEQVPMVWDYLTLSAVLTAAMIEDKPKTVLDSGRTIGDLLDGEFVDFSMTYVYGLDVACVTRGEQELKMRHVFFERSDEHPTVTLIPGDQIRMGRTMRR